MRQTRLLPVAVALFVGVALGGYLFSDSQPRSFLALSNCDHCYHANELAGLLASAGIQKSPAAAVLAVKETDRCIAIEHPFRWWKYHFIIFPKKDIRDIAEVAIDDQPYVLDCLAIIRTLVAENGLRNYRVETNGPARQDVTYLHFHLISSDGYDRPTSAARSSPRSADQER